MVVVPTDTGLATPLALMVATVGTLDVQVAWLVTLAVVLSEKVTVAVNTAVWFADSEMLVVEALIVRLVTVLLLTVRTEVAVTLLLDFAVMVVVPNATAVAKPPVSMVAIAGTEEVQVTDDVTSPVLLSPKVAVALYCWVAWGFT